MGILSRSWQLICTGANLLATAFLAFIMLFMCGEIIGRYVFNRPIPGNLEIVEMCMVVLATVGFAFSLQQGRHIRVTLLLDRLSPRARAVLINLSYITGFVVCATLVWQLIKSANYSVSILEYTAGATAVPMYPFKIILVFSVVLISIQFLINFINGVRGVKK